MTANTLPIDPAQDTAFAGHPRGLFVCFATELWERFSFYGMKYLLLLYLTKYHLFSDANGLDYSGDSLAVAADGLLLEDMADRAGISLVTLDGAALETYREKFPCHMDADEFTLN